MVAYFISGLGADKRLFQKLKLPAELKVVHLDWIAPLKGESMKAYCRRFAAGIDTSTEFVIVGMSFGGMVATELSQMVKPKQTIIISSAGCRQELPWYFKLAGWLKLDVIVPASFLMKANLFTYWYFGADTKEERLLLKHILIDTSPTFLKWAIRAIVTWKRVEKPAGIYHIHGSKDRVLPTRFVHANFIVPEGKHLMVYNMADRISNLLIEQLNGH